MELEQPTAAEKEALAQKFFGHSKSFSHVRWADLSAGEQSGMLLSWRTNRKTSQVEREAEAKARDTAAQTAKTSEKEKYGAAMGRLVKTIDERMVAYIKQVPRMLQADLSALVSKAFYSESGALEERSAALIGRVNERLDNLSGVVSKVNGQGSRISALDLFIGELLTRVSQLEATVAALTVRVEAKGRGDGLH